MAILYFLFSITILVLLLALLLLLITRFIESFTENAPFIPIRKEVESTVIESLELKSGSILYDLGCGNAHLLYRVAETHPEIKIVGIENAFLPYLLAKFFTRNKKYIEIKWGNIFRMDISKATHIFLYLSVPTVNKLFPIIQEQCRPGTRIMSCDFEIRAIQPIKIVDLNNKKSKLSQKLYIYEI